MRRSTSSRCVYMRYPVSLLRALRNPRVVFEALSRLEKNGVPPRSLARPAFPQRSYPAFPVTQIALSPTPRTSMR